MDIFNNGIYLGAYTVIFYYCGQG